MGRWWWQNGVVVTDRPTTSTPLRTPDPGPYTLGILVTNTARWIEHVELDRRVHDQAHARHRKVAAPRTTNPQE